MTFKPGQSGNPAGRSTEKVVANAVRAAINETDPKTQRRKLQIMAEGVVALALDCEQWAVQFVADRLDGKPAQEATITHRRAVPEMSDDELTELVTALGGRQDNAANGNGAATETPIDPSKLN